MRLGEEVGWASEESAEEGEEMSCQAVAEVILLAVILCTERRTLAAVGLEELLQLAGGAGVEDEAVHFVVA